MNARGLGETSKLTEVYRDLRAMNAHVTFIQETKLMRKKADFATTLWKGPAFFGHAPVSARGVAILFSQTCPMVPDPTKTIRNQRFVIVPARWEEKPFLLINIYAPNEHAQRVDFFRALWETLLHSDLLADPLTTIILGGDFNCLDRPSLDKLAGGDHASTYPTILRETLEALESEDAFRSLHPDAREFTWENSTTSTRIDAIFVSRTLLPRIQEVWHEHNPHSDHKRVVLALRPQYPVSIGVGIWTLSSTLLNAPAFQDKIKQATRTTRPADHPTREGWRQALMTKIRTTAQTHQAFLNDIQTCKLEPLNARLAELEERLTRDPGHRTLRFSIKAVKGVIYKITCKKAEARRLFSAAQFFDKGERCTRYFSGLAKKRQIQNTIPSLRGEDGERATNTQDIVKIAHQFYTDLYTATPTCAISTKLLLDQLTRKLTNQQAATLEDPITAKEVERAINTIPTNKSPGPDGLPNELWKEIKDQAATLAELFNEWFLAGEIPAEVQGGIITLLFKKGDPQDIKNYRPITLLNTLAKILTKILTARLSRVMGSLVSPTQTAISGRYIGSNLRLMADLLTYTKKMDSPLGLLLLDQEKAFDKVDWGFMRQTLEAFGFQPNFLQWITLLYKDPTSQLKINNTVSQQIHLRRGVRQGCPLSPLLFVLTLEPFLSAIENDANFQGVLLPNGTRLKQSAFADDTTLFPGSCADVFRAEYWMGVHEKATGATFSRTKSEAIIHGFDPPQHSDFFSTWTTDRHHVFKFLGTPCSLTLNIEEAWEAALVKFTNTLRAWQSCSLSLQGKTVVLKHFAYPVLSYLTSALPVPKGVLQTIQRTSWKFMWNGKKAKVNKETAMISKDLGGIGYPDFEDSFSKAHAKWVSRLLAAWDEPTPWVALAKWSISLVNNKWGHGLSTIITPGSTKVANESPSPFWSSALQQFWKLNPRYELSEGSSKDANIARATPLFNNREIKVNGKPLKGKTWERFANAGIRRLCDLVFFNRIGTYEEVREYYDTDITQHAFNQLANALPQRLVNIATYCPHPVAGSTWAIKEGAVHTVFKISPHDGPPEETWANVWTTEEPFADHIPTFQGKKQIADTSLLRPAEVQFSDRIAVEYLDNRELVPLELKTSPKQTSTTRPKHEDTWTTILRHPPLLPPDWTSTYKRLWKLKVPNRWKDLWWLILRRSLFLGEHAFKANWDEIPHNCKLCHTRETIEHLIHECPRAQTCWSWCRRKWRMATWRGRGNTLEDILLNGDNLWMSLASATFAAIWKARCSEVFDNTDHIPALPLLHSNIKNLISISYNKNNKNSIALWTKRGAFASVVHDVVVFSL